MTGFDMHWKTYILPFIFSGLIHAGMLFALPQSNPAQVQYMRGDSAVRLTLMPSDPARQNRDDHAAAIADAAGINKPEDKKHDIEKSLDAVAMNLYQQEADITETPVSNLSEQEEHEDAVEETQEEPKLEPEPERPEEPEEGEPDRVEEQPEKPIMDDEEAEPDPVEKEPEQPVERDEEAHDELDAPDVPGDVLEEGVESGVEKSHVPRPEYPALARRRGQEGTVTVRISVNSRGGATGVEVASSSGHNALDDAALDAARGARFTPARRAGVPVAAETTIRYTFRLEDRR